MGGGSGDGWQAIPKSLLRATSKTTATTATSVRTTPTSNNNVYTPQAGSGSISRFATPDMSVEHQQAYNNILTCEQRQW
jgi:hypothetical protein